MPCRSPALRTAHPILAAAFACAVAGISPSGADERPPGAGAAPAEDRAILLERGKAELVSYGDDFGTVIIGDTSVASASVAQSDALVLTALSEGATNVILLDEGGDRIGEFLVRVIAPGHRIEVWHGLERDVRSCNPLCVSVGEQTPVAAATTSTPGE